MVDFMQDVDLCELEDIYELAAKARDDGIKVQPRPESQWYRVGDKGIVCLWEPQNRNGTMRISHWWVDEDHHGEGVGSALLDRAIFDADNTAGARVIDIYVHDPEPLRERGFEEADGGNPGRGITYMSRTISE
jgi:GNAT superfamily N-acetyltransferase